MESRVIYTDIIGQFYVSEAGYPIYIKKYREVYNDR